VSFVRRAGALVAAALLGVLALGVASCSDAPAGIAGEPDIDIAADAVEPAPWDLSTPETAVRSYLDWVSFSYRQANSEVVSAVMTPAEWVRVDAYVQLNRAEGKGLEQSLESIELSAVSEDRSTAVIATREDWTYRYFSLDTLEYVTTRTNESYETTYTVVKDATGWLVDSVEASVAEAQ